MSDPTLDAVTDALALLDDNADIDHARDAGTLAGEAAYLTAVHALRRLRDRIAGHGPCHDAAASVWIPDDDFQPVGQDAPTDKRVGQMRINGTNMHVDAWKLTADHGPQEAVEGDDDVEAIFGAVGGDKRWETTDINGDTYVIVATPFC